MIMNFLEEKRILKWIIAVLLIFNITAGVTILLHVSAEKPNPPQNPQTDFLKQELNLNDEQSHGLGRIRSEFRLTSQPIADRIKETRKAMIDEMGQKQPDTILLKQLSDELGHLQGEITYQIANQYLNIKDICTPDQALRLNSAYQYLFGIEDSSQQRGKGYRYRWGARGREKE
jgi:Spy/CpxP family protein refolding chaperone